jgi:hypothetical protein
MKKFMAFYMAPMAAMDEMMKTMTPEKGKEFDASWKGWKASKGAAFVDNGAPLGKNKRVSASGVADVRNEMTGYSIVEAESHEAAAALFTDNPMLVMPGAYVEVVALGSMGQ